MPPGDSLSSFYSCTGLPLNMTIHGSDLDVKVSSFIVRLEYQKVELMRLFKS